MIVWVIAFLVCLAILAWLVESAPEYEEMSSGEWREVKPDEEKNKNLFKKTSPFNQSFKPGIGFFELEKGISVSTILKSIF